MKKLIACLLVAMLLALPLSGLAETAAQDSVAWLFTEEANSAVLRAYEAGRRVSVTLTFEDVTTELTGDPATDQVIADVLNAMEITGYVQGAEVYFAIRMEQPSGEAADLLTLGMAVEETDVYFVSNLIGSGIVVGADEVLPVMERLIDVLAAVGMVDADYVEETKEELRFMWAELETEFVAALSASQQAALALESLNYSSLILACMNLAGKVTYAPVEQQLENCDPAVSVGSITVTGEDVKAVISACFQFVRDNPALADMLSEYIGYDETMATAYSSVAGDPVDFNGFLDQLEKETIEEFGGEGTVDVRIYTGADGVVAVEIVPVDDEGIISYTRLTGSEGVTHTVLFTADDNEYMNLVAQDAGSSFHVDLSVQDYTTTTRVSFDLTNRSAGNLIAVDVVLDMELTETYYGETYTTRMNFTVSDETVLNGDDFTETALATISMDGLKLFTVRLTVESSEPADTIVSGEALRLAELTDDEFFNWFIGAYTSFANWSNNLMLVLPTSVVNLMMTGY